MQDLKQSTATTVEVGPILGEDGKPDTTSALTNADFHVRRGDTWQALHTSATSAPLADSSEQGTRLVTLDATDTGTVGRLSIEVNATGLASPVMQYMVRTAKVYDALDAGTDALEVDLIQWLGVAPLALASQMVQAAADAAGVRAAVGLAAANLDEQLAAIVEDTGTTLPTTLTSIVGYIDTEVALILADTNELQTDWADGGRLDLLLDATAKTTDVTDLDLAAGVLDVLASGHNTAGTIGAKINTTANASDPLVNEVPGSYPMGTAGYYIAQLQDILQQVALIQPDTPITAVSVLTGSTLTFVAGRNYPAADGRALRIAIPQPIDASNVCSLVIATEPSPGTPSATTLLQATGTFVHVGADDWYAEFDLTAAQTALCGGTSGTSLTVRRTWDLVEVLSDGDVIPIYTASRCDVTTLLTRTSL